MAGGFAVGMVLDFLLPKKERKEKVFKPAEKLRVQNYHHTTPMAGNLSGEILGLGRLSRQARRRCS